MWFCHGRRDTNFYIKHDNRVLVSLHFAEGTDDMTYSLADPSVLNEDDMQIVLLKVAEGIAQRAQYLPQETLQ